MFDVLCSMFDVKTSTFLSSGFLIRGSSLSALNDKAPCTHLSSLLTLPRVKPFKRTFATPNDALRWLRRILPLIPKWKDNTRFTAEAINLRCDYPVKLKLPRGAVFVGFENIESPLKPDFFINPDLRQLREISKVARVADLFELFAYHHRPGVRRGEIYFGYGGGNGQTRLRFYNPYEKGADLAAQMESYREVFAALGLDIRVELIGKTMQFTAPKRVHIRGNWLSMDDNPSELTIHYDDRTPGYGLQQFSRLIHAKGREIVRTGLFRPIVVGVWKGPKLPVSPRALDVIDHLNAAALPIKKLTAEIWCTVSSWDKLQAIAELAAMDIERINFDLNIIAVKLGPKLDGVIIASPRKRGFEIGIYPTDTAKVDESAFAQALLSLNLPN